MIKVRILRLGRASWITQVGLDAIINVLIGQWQRDVCLSRAEGSAPEAQIGGMWLLAWNSRNAALEAERSKELILP